MHDNAWGYCVRLARLYVDPSRSVVYIASVSKCGKKEQSSKLGVLRRERKIGTKSRQIMSEDRETAGRSAHLFLSDGLPRRQGMQQKQPRLLVDEPGEPGTPESGEVTRALGAWRTARGSGRERG
jgi:hypothetical protein